MNRRLLGALTAVPVALAVVGTGTADAAVTATPPSYTDGVYVVQMVDLPVVAYDGAITGYAATKPAKGTKIDPQAAAVTKYVDRLKGTHNQALGTVGASAKLYDYAYTYNGFAARLTADQAKKLNSVSGVLSVSKQQTYSIDTSTTPAFLGLTDKGGLWDQLGGTQERRRGRRHRHHRLRHLARVALLRRPRRRDGHAVVRPERQARLPEHAPGLHGKCTVGRAVDAAATATRSSSAPATSTQGQGGNAAHRQRQARGSSTPPRDYNGHGTHTASTAGGNHGVPVTGAAAGVRHGISGMAPRARIAAYKALWSTESGDTAGGTTSDLVAAIDQAVADGVDVINYSISGTQTNFADPVGDRLPLRRRRGRLRRRLRGQQRPGRVDRRAPVARGSRPSRPARTTATATARSRWATASTYTGASLAARGRRLRSSTRRRRACRAPTRPRSPCATPAPTAATSSTRPRSRARSSSATAASTGRTNKSLAVKEAGGVGMILTNTSPNSLNADFHFVPTVHLAATVRAAVKAYAATAGATATINKATLTTTAPAPFTASFSSRGPLLAGGGDLLKPDVIAPGQDILAACSPMTNQGYGLQPALGHVDVEPARRRPRCAAQGPAPRLVADGGQERPHDDRLRRPGRHLDDEPDLPPGRGPRPAQLGGRPGPRLRQHMERLARLPLRQLAGRRRLDVRCAHEPRLQHRPERLERRLDRGRRPRRHADRHPQGHQRQRQGGDLHRLDVPASPGSPSRSTRRL